MTMDSRCVMCGGLRYEGRMVKFVGSASLPGSKSDIMKSWRAGCAGNVTFVVWWGRGVGGPA